MHSARIFRINWFQTDEIFKTQIAFIRNYFRNFAVKIALTTDNQ